MQYSQTLPGNQDTGLVTFTIKVNGEAVSNQFQVASISVINEVNRIPSAKVIIFDGDAAAQDFPASNEATFIPGAEIEILAGYNSNDEPIFKGIVVKHSIKIRNENSPLLILDCRDKAVKMTVARKNKYFYSQTDSDIAEQIINTYGLTADVKATKVQHAAMVQFDCTDWDFIVSRMEANGMYCSVNGGKIAINKPDYSQSAVLDAVYGATIYEFDADLDSRDQYSSVKASTWDQANQEINDVSATDPTIQENGNISSSDLASVLGIDEYDVFAGEEINENELQALADARFQKARMSKCRGKVRFQGFGALNPGDLINIGGVGDRFSGIVFVSGVRQEIANGAWTTDVQFGMSNELFINQPQVNSNPAAGMLPMINGLQIGIVTQLENDPDSENRIQVRLPIISPGEEGIWMRIASLDAGKKRGAFFLPEVGDEVVVGFLNNDPRHAVVLGMLNSSANPAPLKASDKNDEKGFVTRSGMKMVFNDADNSLKIETPGGKKLTIDESAGVMSLEDENGNKFSMDATSVTINSAGSMSLNASGNLTIKGAMVSIN